MAPIKLFRDIDSSSWKIALRWLGYTLIIGLVPIWLGIIIALLCAPNTLSLFVDRAQLAIYSTALLSTGFYIVGREFKSVQFPGRHWFQLIMIILIIVAVAISSVATIDRLFVGISSVINYSILRYLSIGAFVLTTLVVFVLYSLNISLEFRDVTGTKVEQENKLEADYDSLEEVANDNE